MRSMALISFSALVLALNLFNGLRSGSHSELGEVKRTRVSSVIQYVRRGPFL